MVPSRIALICLVFALLFAWPQAPASVAAQSTHKSPGTTGSTQPKVPPYEPQLLRLSEILGAVHYLTRICPKDAKSDWREQMNLLIEAEKPSPERRRDLVDRFNRGYHGFSDVYRRCTPSAKLAIERYMREGADIAKFIVSRYSK